jgi:hypothetical protein
VQLPFQSGEWQQYPKGSKTITLLSSPAEGSMHQYMGKWCVHLFAISELCLGASFRGCQQLNITNMSC